MPEQRLQNARKTLPDGYRFGDAQWQGPGMGPRIALPIAPPILMEHEGQTYEVVRPTHRQRVWSDPFEGVPVAHHPV